MDAVIKLVLSPRNGIAFLLALLSAWRLRLETVSGTLYVLICCVILVYLLFWIAGLTFRRFGKAPQPNTKPDRSGENV